MILSAQGDGGENRTEICKVSLSPRVTRVESQIWVGVSWQTKISKKSELSDFHNSWLENPVSPGEVQQFIFFLKKKTKKTHTHVTNPELLRAKTTSYSSLWRILLQGIMGTELLYWGKLRRRSVSWGCHNHVPHTGWLKTTDIYSVTVLEARSLKSRCCHAPSKAPLPALSGSNIPWLAAASLQPLPLSWRDHLPSVSVSPLFMWTPVIANEGHTLLQHDLVENYIFSDPISKYCGI